MKNVTHPRASASDGAAPPPTAKRPLPIDPRWNPRNSFEIFCAPWTDECELQLHAEETARRKRNAAHARKAARARRKAAPC